MPITKPADNNTSWGPAFRATIGAVNAQNTIYSAEPPPGLDPLPTSNTADATAIVQAHLDAVATAGGGRVVLAKPGQIVRFLTGLTIPAAVQLTSDEKTLLDFTQISSGAAITVNDNNFTPLVGIRMDGGMFTPTSGDLTSSYTGVKVTGHGLVFEKLHIQYFGRGIDLANNSTFIVTVRDSGIANCATAVYNDIETAGVGNSGERITFDGCTLANSRRGFIATAGGQHMRFENCSIDFCDEAGKVNNAHIQYLGHIECNGAYIFDVTGNSQLFFGNTTMVLSKCVMFKTGQGPSNYGFGGARFDNCGVFFVDNVDAAQNVRSEHMVQWGTGVTSLTVYVPFPLKWCAITADFCFNDGTGVPNADKVRVVSMSSTTGALILEAPSYSGTRWVRIKF